MKNTAALNRKSIRLKGWDYSSDAYYFITICTENRKHSFGEIRNKKMCLSEIGKRAEEFWQKIPARHKMVALDEFIVMPNHIHGILIINTFNTKTCQGMHQQSQEPKLNQFAKPIANSVSMIINHFKGDVTKSCRKNNLDFAWQSRFYDHIIRDERALNNIRDYISKNPLLWDQDKNNIGAIHNSLS